MDITNEQWQRIAEFIPEPKARPGQSGRPPQDPRAVLNGILWILRTGAPWRDLPERFGPWRTVYGYFKGWQADGTFDRVLEALQIRLDREGKIDWDLWCIDGSSVRASRAAAGASKKASPGTPPNPKTTRWAAREADSAASSTWLLMARACRWRSK